MYSYCVVRSSSTLVYVYEASSSWPFTHTVCIVVLWFMYMKPLLHGLLQVTVCIVDGSVKLHVY